MRQAAIVLAVLTALALCSCEYAAPSESPYFVFSCNGATTLMKCNPTTESVTPVCTDVYDYSLGRICSISLDGGDKREYRLDAHLSSRMYYRNGVLAVLIYGDAPQMLSGYDVIPEAVFVKGENQ